MTNTYVNPNNLGTYLPDGAYFSEDWPDNGRSLVVD